MELKYKEVLELFQKNGWELLPLCLYLNRGAEERVLGLRHDTDDDLARSKAIARLEREMDIQSTFFLLTTHSYYSRVVVNYFWQLGMDVGLHLDYLSIVLSNQNVHKHIIDNLQDLLEIGIRTVGVSAHGSPIARPLNFHGWEYFRDYAQEEYYLELKKEETRKSEFLLMGVHPLKEYGLMYDAIKLPKEHYISDSHGRIRVDRHLDEESTIDDLIKFAENGTGRTIALFHPQYWDI